MNNNRNGKTEKKPAMSAGDAERSENRYDESVRNYEIYGGEKQIYGKSSEIFGILKHCIFKGSYGGNRG